MNIGDEQRV